MTCIGVTIIDAVDGHVDEIAAVIRTGEWPPADAGRPGIAADREPRESSRPSGFESVPVVLHELGLGRNGRRPDRVAVAGTLETFRRCPCGRSHLLTRHRGLSSDLAAIRLGARQFLRRRKLVALFGHGGRPGGCGFDHPRIARDRLPHIPIFVAKSVARRIDAGKCANGLAPAAPLEPALSWVGLDR